MGSTSGVESKSKEIQNTITAIYNNSKDSRVSSPDPKDKNMIIPDVIAVRDGVI